MNSSHVEFSSSHAEIKCPKCGYSMYVKTNRITKNKFWGCSMYPVCNHTVAIDPLPELEPPWEDPE